MNIEQDISLWNGKSSADIEAIYLRYHADSHFLTSIIQLLGKQPIQNGASWLLKHYIEQGGAIDTGETSGILGELNNLADWQARLHILQCLDAMSIPEAGKETVEYFLRDNLTSENKFVRAWAYNGLYVLSLQFPEFRKETGKILEMALKDEAPSVKARIRNIMKKGF